MSSPKPRNSQKKKLEFGKLPSQHEPLSPSTKKSSSTEKLGSASKTKKLALSPKMSINTENFVISKVGSFDKEYMVVGKIGQGSFGSVYKVYHKGLKSFRALKTIKKNPNSKYSIFEEIEILKKLDHSNILKIYEFYEAKESLYIVTDFFEGKQLFDEILENEKISEQIAIQIVIEILRALNYIHSQGIAHRDIKAENILLKKVAATGESKQEKFKVKIIDWGLGTLLDASEEINRVCGTPQYCAPQVLSGKYSTSCDIWSLGVLVYVMLTGEMPFSGKNSQETIEQVKKGSINIKDRSFRKISKLGQSFIVQMIKKNPSQRPTAEHLLNHEWIKSYTSKTENKSPPEHLKETLERLREFKVTNCFGVAVVTYVNNHLTTEEQKEKLIEIFKFLDKNGDGVLSAQELIEGYSEIYGRAMAEQIAQETFQKLDINQNGSLEFSEFVAFGLQRHTKEEREKLKQAFSLFDRNGDGQISMDEIKSILIGKFEGETISEEDIRDIIKQIDQDGDEEINFEEFVRCVDTIYEKVSKQKGRQKRSMGEGSKIKGGKK